MNVVPPLTFLCARRYRQGSIVDRFGEADGDAVDQGWNFKDGWAYRANGTGNNPSVYGPWVGAVDSSWSRGHADILDAYATNAAAAADGNQVSGCALFYSVVHLRVPL